MRLRAIPGSGQEWLVLDDDDIIIATFHGYKMGSDKPQKMAEILVGAADLVEQLQSAHHQMQSGFNPNAGNLLVQKFMERK